MNQSGTGEKYIAKVTSCSKCLQNCIGVLADDATGDRITETIYDDADPDQIETLPDTRLHRNVDLELLRADKEGVLHCQLLFVLSC